MKNINPLFAKEKVRVSKINNIIETLKNRDEYRDLDIKFEDKGILAKITEVVQAANEHYVYYKCRLVTYDVEGTYNSGLTFTVDKSKCRDEETIDLYAICLDDLSIERDAYSKSYAVGDIIMLHSIPSQEGPNAYEHYDPELYCFRAHSLDDLVRDNILGDNIYIQSGTSIVGAGTNAVFTTTISHIKGGTFSNTSQVSFDTGSPGSATGFTINDLKIDPMGHTGLSTNSKSIYFDSDAWLGISGASGTTSTLTVTFNHESAQAYSSALYTTTFQWDSGSAQSMSINGNKWGFDAKGHYSTSLSGGEQLILQGSNYSTLSYTGNTLSFSHLDATLSSTQLVLTRTNVASLFNYNTTDNSLSLNSGTFNQYTFAHSNLTLANSGTSTIFLVPPFSTFNDYQAQNTYRSGWLIHNGSNKSSWLEPQGWDGTNYKDTFAIPYKAKDTLSGTNYIAGSITTHTITPGSIVVSSSGTADQTIGIPTNVAMPQPTTFSGYLLGWGRNPSNTNSSMKDIPEWYRIRENELVTSNGTNITVISAPPSTGTYHLKSVNGVISWAAYP
jgi:hypothetical protein